MTRRDMIIIAILVNAGLLAILFMMAINSDTDKVSDPIAMPQTATEVNIAMPAASVSEPAFMPPSPPEEANSSLSELNAVPVPLPVIEETVIAADANPAAIEPAADAPSAVAPAPKEPEQKIVEVTVKRGDSLDKIARANGTTVKEIKAANNLTSTRLDIGQVLKVPVGTKKNSKDTKETKAEAKPSKAPAKAAAKPAKSSDNKQVASSNESEYYTIKSGDNPWKIARQFHIKVDDLLKMNNLDEAKARNLKAGDKIRVR